MATHTGNAGIVSVDGTEVGEIRDWSLEETSEMTTDTVMGDTWVTNKPTLKSWTASVNMYWNEADAGQLLLVTGAEVALVLYPEGNTSGDVTYSGQAIIASISRSASFDGMIEASLSATGNGALTQGAVV